MRATEFMGRRFGRLTVVARADDRPGVKNKRWHCICDCGGEIDAFASNLVSGRTQSCGCLNREQISSMHEHLHYQNGTCVERLERVRSEGAHNKTGFRGLFQTKSGKYRASISFQKKRYTLGYFDDFNDAVNARLEAEDELQGGYLEAFKRYEVRASADPIWAAENPFYFQASRRDGRFEIETNEA